MTQLKTPSRNDADVARRDDQPEFPQRLCQWDLVELAAEGNLCRIYRARPAESGADRRGTYAVKLLRRRFEDDPQTVGLLAREALVGRSLSHPHLVPILRASVRQKPRFVVMPWLDGSTLRSQLDAGHGIDLPAALWMARQVAEALEALHAAGWMHGDIKPGNIFISPEGHVTLLDLEFARRTDETGSAVDRGVLGTSNYFAPELVTSTYPPDIRSDLYSLGVVLFEVLAGRLPFLGKDLAELAVQHRSSAPPDLLRLAPYLPPEVIRLVRQLLAKDPLRRPQTPDELIDRLTRLEIATFSQRVLA